MIKSSPLRSPPGSTPDSIKQIVLTVRKTFFSNMYKNKEDVHLHPYTVEFQWLNDDKSH